MHADDQFLGIAAPDHRLHREAVDSAGRLFLYPRPDIGRRMPRTLRVAQVEHDAADVGFVRNAAGQQFDHYCRRGLQQPFGRDRHFVLSQRG